MYVSFCLIFYFYYRISLYKLDFRILNDYDAYNNDINSGWFSNIDDCLFKCIDFDDCVAGVVTALSFCFIKNKIFLNTNEKLDKNFRLRHKLETELFHRIGIFH